MFCAESGCWAKSNINILVEELFEFPLSLSPPTSVLLQTLCVCITIPITGNTREHEVGYFVCFRRVGSSMVDAQGAGGPLFLVLDEKEVSPCGLIHRSHFPLEIKQILGFPVVMEMIWMRPGP